MKNIYIGLFLSFLISSCQKDVNVKIPYEKDQIVLNSLFFADSTIYAKVFKSLRLTNTFNQPIIDNATLTLFEDGLPVGTFTKQTLNFSQWYVSPKKSVVGKEYKIVATAPEFPTVEGADFVPKKPSVQLLSVSSITTANNANYDNRIKFKLNDEAIVNNYYRIRIYKADTSLVANGPRFIYPNGKSPLSSNIEGIDGNINALLGNEIRYENFISDELFNGRETVFNVLFDASNSANSSHYEVEVTALSRSTYLYLKSLELQRNLSSDPLAEAVPVFNNIKNGFGIVGAANESYSFIRKQ